tara:strand:- start:698 stop:1294 length:597 start_codon:yes stop_codon:yes gene_type:complete
MYTVFVRTLLVSESNMRENRFVKAKRKKKQRQATRNAWLVSGAPVITGPISLKLTRVVSKRRLIRDYDNLVGCFKAVIDEVADIAGINDKDIIWGYDSFAQEAGDEIGVRIEIMARLGTDLTEMQKGFFETMVRLWDAVGIPPTLREMKAADNAVGTSPQCFVQYLELKGYIRKIPGVSRGIVLTKRGAALKRAVLRK